MAMPVPVSPSTGKISKKKANQIMLVEQCRVLKLPQPELEVEFARQAIGRNWRFDCAWRVARLPPPPGGAVANWDLGRGAPSLRPDFLFAVEIDGGAFLASKGKHEGWHSSGAGLRSDCEKFWEAAILGWTVLRVMPEHVKSGQAVRWIERLFKDRGIIP